MRDEDEETICGSIQKSDTIFLGFSAASGYSVISRSSVHGT